MHLIILAGGRGTRIKSILADLPKPMAPIKNKPFLEYILDFLSNKSITNISLAICHLGHIIENHFQSNYKGLKLTYVKEKIALGTGGAVLNAAKSIEEQSFMVMNGDSFASFDIDDLLETFKQKKKNIIVVTWVPDVTRYGSVEFNEYITSFSEKNKNGGGYINTGIYILNKNIFDNCVSESFSLEELLASSVDKHEFVPYIINSNFIDIGTIEDLARAEDFFTNI